MNKKELRKHFLQQQKVLSLKQQTEFSQQICEQFFNFTDLSEIHTLHIFLPIEKNNEINTWLIINYLQAHFPAIQIAAPKVESSTFTIQNFVLSKETSFIINPWGITEPENGEIIEARQIDLVVLPLLCFDEKGFRVGYGKGFYDRFLANCRTDIKKTGLSYFSPVPMIEDINQFDIAMNVCITPEENYIFPGF
ncbi:MAG: 5-formyltetrahydrofolate cyclo-ligase [Verrucomicrobia bacterium]|nr:5-formyltetrahydrofolate cyclo-ligase [Cytophagales bacterium]